MGVFGACGCLYCAFSVWLGVKYPLPSSPLEGGGVRSMRANGGAVFSLSERESHCLWGLARRAGQTQAVPRKYDQKYPTEYAHTPPTLWCW